MAPDPTPIPSEIIAVAFVVETSLAVANEWRQILVEYVGVMMRRLTEAYPKYVFRIAFISYSSADTNPSPLLCKRFFTDYTQVVKVMKEEPSALGIGQTHSGGSRGMAALEGLVAAIELFDALETSLRDDADPSNPRRVINHIVHIAAAPPDDSAHPMFNDTPDLDTVSWETLHEECRKRNIYYNIINLRQQVPQYSGLHGAITSTGKSSNPWFPVRPNHSVLLSGFPPAAQPKSAPKRPNDIGDRAVDSKRARLSDSSQSQNNAHPASFGNSKQEISSQHQRAPAVPPTNTSPIAHNPLKGPAPEQYQFMLERVRAAEIQLLNLSTLIDAARAAGRLEQAEGMSQAFKKKQDSLTQVKQALLLYKPGITQSNAPDRPSPKLSAQAQKSAERSTSRDTFTPPTISQENSTPVLSQTTSTMASFPSTVPANTSTFTPGIQVLPPNPVNNQTQAPPQISSPFIPQPNGAEMAAQLQKLVDQQRNRQPIPPMTLQHNSPQFATNLNPMMQQSALPQSNAATNAPSAPSVVWSGPLKWSGQGANGTKKEVQCHVIAVSQNPMSCHSNTWAPSFLLVPTREPAVSMPELQAWMGLHKPIMCPIQPDPRAQDPQNMQNYNSLVMLLNSRSIYATAAWTTPNGGQTNNVLFFPYSNNKLCGAFFPLTGIPEMPRMSTIGNGPMYPQSVNKPMVNMPQQFMAQLQQMSADKRNAFLMEVKRRQIISQNSGMGNPLAANLMPAGPSTSMSAHNGMINPFNLALSNPLGSQHQNGNGMLPQNQGPS